MTRTGISLTLAAFACLLHAVPATAASRTFVSGLGNDANPCTLTQPCRTLQAAFNATSVDGEIDVLDPTGYGSLVITHSVLVEGHGWASMNGSGSGNAIAINAGPSDTITLRGLIIDGVGTGSNGIVVSTAGALIIDDCVVRRFQEFGVLHTAVGSRLSVSNSLFTGNEGAFFIQAENGTATTRVSISRTVISGNGAGLSIAAGGLVAPGALLVSISDSDIAGNATLGIGASNATGSGLVDVLVTRTSIVENDTGVSATNAAAFVRLNQSTIAHNATGWVASGGGQVVSWGNNAFADINGTGDAIPTAAPSSLR